MGLKGYRLWVMGQLDSRAEPHLERPKRLRQMRLQLSGLQPRCSAAGCI
jgi:hypothetical protein